MSDVYGEAGFYLKQKKTKMRLPLRARVEKTIHGGLYNPAKTAQHSGIKKYSIYYFMNINNYTQDRKQYV